MARIKYRLPDNLQQGVKFRVPKTHPLKTIRNSWLYYIGPSPQDENRHVVYCSQYLRYSFRNVCVLDTHTYEGLEAMSYDLSWPYSWGVNNSIPVTHNLRNCYWLSTKELHLCAYKTEPKFKGLSMFLLKHDMLPGEKYETEQHLVFTREMYERDPQF